VSILTLAKGISFERVNDLQFFKSFIGHIEKDVVLFRSTVVNINGGKDIIGTLFV
jgi:hypothetical protein